MMRWEGELQDRLDAIILPDGLHISYTEYDINDNLPLGVPVNNALMYFECDYLTRVCLGRHAPADHYTIMT